MSILNLLSDEKTWESFYSYKSSLTGSDSFCDELRKYVDDRAYLPVCRSIAGGESFPLPKKAVINKMSSNKSRTVYTYPAAENTVLKLITYLVLRKYDSLFCPNLYSFRPGKTAKDAVKRLLRFCDIGSMYAYKADISNYFNSIPVESLLPKLHDALSDDEELYAFLSGLLTEKNVRDGDRVIIEQKGIMAGTPIASFYANLYLRELDSHFHEAGVIYMRYSDDVIVFADTYDEVQAHAAYIREYLKKAHLTLNPDKECFFTPEEGFTFLGFRCVGKTVDIAPVTVDKLKGKMRRKTRSLMRWAKRNNVDGEKAAKAFIRIFNRKLLESPDDNELSWSYWFFSVINTADSLRVIDNYAQYCLRCIVSHTRTKKRFDTRYEDLKRLGYRSLVHAFYDFETVSDKR